MSFDGLMIHSVTIKSFTIPAAGNQINLGRTAVHSNVPARIEPTSSSRSPHPIGRHPNETHRMFLRSKYEIKSGYVVTDQDGVEYEVIGVDAYSDGSDLHHKQVSLARRKVMG